MGVSEQAPIRDKHWKDAYAFANAPERQHDFVGSLAQLLANHDRDVRREMLEAAGERIHFVAQGEGRIVERDEYYTTIATRGLEMTCWNDEVKLTPPVESGAAQPSIEAEKVFDARADNQDMAMLLMMCAPTFGEIPQQRAGIFPDSQMQRLVEAAKAIRKDAFAAGAASKPSVNAERLAETISAFENGRLAKWAHLLSRHILSQVALPPVEQPWAYAIETPGGDMHDGEYAIFSDANSARDHAQELSEEIPEEAPQYKAVPLYRAQATI